MEHGRLDRRTFLTVTTATALGFVGSVRADTRGKLRPVVIFFQGGAQSPYEFVSPLVDSPKEIRGNVEATQGIDSRWTEFRKVMGDTHIVRSLDARNTAHNAHYVLGETAKMAQSLAKGGIPDPLIELPSVYHDLSQIKAGFHIRYDDQEKRFLPPTIAAPDPHLPGRFRLLQEIERPIQGSAPERMHQLRELAASLLLNGGKLEAPFIASEKCLERYGDNEIGKAAALASEFAKSGSGLTIVYNEFHSGWDMHNNVKERSDALIPPTDTALRALVEDSRRFGFVLLMTTEHGRSPKINFAGGRDHYEVAYAVLSGSGIAPGETGSVDKHGDIKDGKVTGTELMKTVAHAAGLTKEKVGTISSALA